MSKNNNINQSMNIPITGQKQLIEKIMIIKMETLINEILRLSI